ncbi:transcriptional regulator [Thermosipho globiformans]|uniref:transcriptional regulator n=1 Tax=Thermosipho globiformans TaxID=380685 RepID=UPI000F8F5085|nr:transcriptional regulator [Thermosipho globiformans]
MIPLNPVGKQEIHKLESILLYATLFRKDVLDLIKDPSERLTWVDSLAVASSAIAREKAGMKIPEIAEELGRTEQTIRKHLKGESKAGQIVRETYKMLKQGEIKESQIAIDSILEENEKLKQENLKLKNLLKDIIKQIQKTI